jgi:hypothetical protein
MRNAVKLAQGIAGTQAYFELQELDRRLSIARNSTGAFQSTYLVFNRRYDAGITSRLAVTRAESALAEASGSVADIERQIAVKEHEICILLGRNPGAIQRASPSGEAQVPSAIPAGLPSSLLERRPDLLSFVREVDGVAVSRRYENLTVLRELSAGTAVRHFNVMHHMMKKATTIWSKETELTGTRPTWSRSNGRTINATGTSRLRNLAGSSKRSMKERTARVRKQSTRRSIA